MEIQARLMSMQRTMAIRGRIDVGAHLKRYTERRNTCKVNKNAITEVKKYPKRERKNTDSLKTIYEDDNLDENDGDSDKENDGYDHETTVKRKKRVKRNRKINENEDLDEGDHGTSVRTKTKRKEKVTNTLKKKKKKNSADRVFRWRKKAPPK